MLRRSELGKLSEESICDHAPAASWDLTGSWGQIHRQAEHGLTQAASARGDTTPVASTRPPVPGRRRTSRMAKVKKISGLSCRKAGNVQTDQRETSKQSCDFRVPLPGEGTITRGSMDSRVLHTGPGQQRALQPCGAGLRPPSSYAGSLEILRPLTTPDASGVGDSMEPALVG